MSGLLYDLTALDYVEEEYLLEGTARSFALVGERGGDGRWSVAPDGEAAFVTRLLVRRPADPGRFSGTVVAEWLNVSGGRDGSPDWTMLHPHIVRRGHAWVGVSAQKVGIEGGGRVDGMHLRKLDPVRYGQLSHPGDAFAYDIFTQAGRVLRAPSGVSALGPLTATRLLAAGESQSAAFLVTYINAVDDHAAVFDGFLVHGRGAAGAALDGFRLPATGDLEEARRQMSRHPERIRSDNRVPVIVLQSETDVAPLGGGLPAQPDGDRLRVWEIAGTAHGDTYMLVAGAHDDGRLPPERLAALLRPVAEALGVPTDSPINGAPQQHFVAQTALAWLDGWSGGGDPPPAAARLETTADGAALVVDEHGNARGGIRTPWVDVPTAVYSGLGQSGAVFSMLFGRTVAFDQATLQRLYPGGLPDYLDRFASALDRAIAAGFLLDDDRNQILDLAAPSYPTGAE